MVVAAIYIKKGSSYGTYLFIIKTLTENELQFYN